MSDYKENILDDTEELDFDDDAPQKKQSKSSSEETGEAPGKKKRVKKQDPIKLKKLLESFELDLATFEHQVAVLEGNHAVLQMYALGCSSVQELQNAMIEVSNSEEFKKALAAKQAKDRAADLAKINRMREAAFNQVWRNKLADAVKNLNYDDKQKLVEKYKEWIHDNVQFIMDNTQSTQVLFPLVKRSAKEKTNVLVGLMDFIDLPSRYQRANGRQAWKPKGSIDPLVNKYIEVEARWKKLNRMMPKASGKTGDMLYNLLIAKKIAASRIPEVIPVLQGEKGVTPFRDIPISAMDLAEAVRIPMDLGISTEPMLTDPSCLSPLLQDLADRETLPKMLIVFPDHVNRDEAWPTSNKTSFLETVLLYRGEWQASTPMILQEVANLQVNGESIPILLLTDGGQRTRTVLRMFADEVPVTFGYPAKEDETSEPSKIHVRYSLLAAADDKPEWKEAADLLRHYGFATRIHAKVVGTGYSETEIQDAFDNPEDPASHDIISTVVDMAETQAQTLFLLANRDNLRREEMIKPSVGTKAMMQINRVLRSRDAEMVLRKAGVLPEQKDSSGVLKGSMATSGRGKHIELVASAMLMALRQIYTPDASLGISNKMLEALRESLPRYSEAQLGVGADSIIQAMTLFVIAGESLMKIRRPGGDEEVINKPFIRMGLAYFAKTLAEYNLSAEGFLTELGGDVSSGAEVLRNYYEELKNSVRYRKNAAGQEVIDEDTSMVELVSKGTNNTGRMKNIMLTFENVIGAYLLNKLGEPEVEVEEAA